MAACCIQDIAQHSGGGSLEASLVAIAAAVTKELKLEALVRAQIVVIAGEFDR
jgi:hypothetical protein